MDSKYFILILFCGYLKSTVFSDTEAITKEKQPRSYVSPSSQNTTGNFLGQTAQFDNVSSEQSTPPAKTVEQPITTTLTPFGKTAAYTSGGQSFTKQPIPKANTSSQRTVQPVLTSARQTPPTDYTSKQVLLSVYSSSRKPAISTDLSLSTQLTSTVKGSPRSTPGFILKPTIKNTSSQKSNSNSTAAIFIGIILTFMLIAIIVIVLWKCLRKPVLNDQNWAGRSPFADGETPDMCLDNIRENETSTKRTSIISLMAWKPSKSALLADDLEIKLFESSENIEDSNNSKAEKIKDQANGTSEDSADGSTIGTAVSSSDDADLPPPPPSLLDLEGQESNQADEPAVTIVPLINDSTNPLPSPDCPNQVCEDHNSEFKQSFPPPPDSFNLPSPPADIMNNQEDCNNDIQSHESPTLLVPEQELNEFLPPPPEELS